MHFSRSESRPQHFSGVNSSLQPASGRNWESSYNDSQDVFVDYHVRLSTSCCVGVYNLCGVIFCVVIDAMLSYSSIVQCCIALCCVVLFCAVFYLMYHVH